MGIVAWLASLRASESKKCIFQSFWLQPCMLQRLRASGATTWPGFKQGPSCGLPQRQRGYQQGRLAHGPSSGTHGADEACGLADCLLISARVMPPAWAHFSPSDWQSYPRDMQIVSGCSCDDDTKNKLVDSSWMLNGCMAEWNGPR